MNVLSIAVLALCVLAQGVHLWADYTKSFQKHYGSSEEEAKRQACFHKNLKLIGEAQAADPSASYGVNEFSDLCADEFKLYHNLQSKQRERKFAPLFSVHEISSIADQSVDWRTKGAVTGVKNQLSCGSCWAFSAVGNMEGQHFLSTGKLLSFSEEELVQCSNPKNDPNGNQGCNGGDMDLAFDWVVANGGITSESDYPYTSGGGTTGTCISSKLKNVVANFTGHVDISPDENQMATWVATYGPLSVAVDAGFFWQIYAGGIKSSCTAGQLDHGVLIVGFGTANGTPYWIVKNSWGPTWGESGYIRLKRGVNCNGIKQQASSVKV